MSKIEKMTIGDKEVHVIRQSDPEKPTPTPKLFCRIDQVDSFIETLDRYLKRDTNSKDAGYYRELKALLEDGTIPLVM